MTSQDLRDLVGWAGAAGALFVEAGDFQDFFLETVRLPGPPPDRFRLQKTGSLQSSAYGNDPSAAFSWLTTGVWMDLLAQVAPPTTLDVQLIHGTARWQFSRWGHLRLTAQKAAHQWAVQFRRPGTTRIQQPVEPLLDTGSLPEFVSRMEESWIGGQDVLWRGLAPGVESVPDDAVPSRALEGFHQQTGSSFSFGFWSPNARFKIEHLRDLAWMAGDSGASRIWLTPGRVLLFQGIPQVRESEWTRWAGEKRLPARHGDLDHAVRAAGAGAAAQGARREVLAYLTAENLLPAGDSLLVASETLNRGDGACAVPFPVVIQTAGSWLYRTGDGLRSGEGTLEAVLAALGRPLFETEVVSGEPSPIVFPGTHRCRSCLTWYEPRWGDPQASVASGTLFDQLPAGWVCPVCGGPRSGYEAIKSGVGNIF
jgi:rubredoxin